MVQIPFEARYSLRARPAGCIPIPRGTTRTTSPSLRSIRTAFSTKRKLRSNWPLALLKDLRKLSLCRRPRSCNLTHGGLPTTESKYSPSGRSSASTTRISQPEAGLPKHPFRRLIAACAFSGLTSTPVSACARASGLLKCSGYLALRCSPTATKKTASPHPKSRILVSGVSGNCFVISEAASLCV